MKQSKIMLRTVCVGASLMIGLTACGKNSDQVAESLSASPSIDESTPSIDTSTKRPDAATPQSPSSDSSNKGFGLNAPDDADVQRAIKTMTEFAENHDTDAPKAEGGALGFSQQHHVISVFIENNEYELALYVFKDKNEVGTYLKDAQNHFTESGGEVEITEQDGQQRMVVLADDQYGFYLVTQYEKYLLLTTAKNSKEDAETNTQEIMDILSR